MGLARSRAEAGASVPRTGEPRPGGAGAAPTFPAERPPGELEQDPQKGGDALGLPGTLTGTCAPGRARHTPRTSSLKGGSAPRGPENSSTIKSDFQD